MSPHSNSEIIKEGCITCLTFTTFVMVASCRSYVAFQVPQLQEKSSDITITSDEASWIPTLTILPNPVGCILGGILMDAIGRKLTLQLIFIPFAIAWTVLSVATTVKMIYIGTLINGLVAGACYCSSTYIAEISTAEHRGPLLSFLEPTFTFGVLLCNILVHNLGWRRTAVCFVGSSLVCFLLMFFLPESPSWLLTRGREKKARKILTWLRGSPAEAGREIIEIENSLDQMSRTKRPITRIIVETCKSWKPLALLIGLATLQRICGCPILESYTVKFFDALALPINSRTAAIGHSTTNFITSFFTPFVVQKLSRRVLLGVSSSVMGAAMLIVAIYQMINYDVNSSHEYYALVLASIYGYDIASTLGVLPLPFILAGELFPTENRGLLNGIYGCFSFLISAMVVKLFPTFLHSVGIINVVLSFSLVCFVTIFYSIFLLPETSGKTLTEIQVTYFRKKMDHHHVIDVEYSNCK